LAAWKSSGLTGEAFARRHGGVSAAALYAWRRAGKQGRQLAEAKGHARNAAGRTRGAYSETERVAAVTAYRSSGLTQRSFAATWGLSIKTLGQWLQRAEQEGGKGLQTRRRGRPKGARNKPSPRSAAVASAIVETKARFPSFGLRKVAAYLGRFGGLRVSPTTVRTALAQAGVPASTPVRKPRRKKPLPRRFERARPNQLWQSDITSMVLPRSGNRVYLTVFLDDHSRYIVSWALSSQQRAGLVIEALRDGIARYGKPAEVLTDQGRQYFAWRGKSAFQKELLRQGIRHVVARAHHPQTVGKCERLWETVQRELWDRVQASDIGEARERMGHFFAHYNHFRPHQGIRDAVPADRFFGAEKEVRAALEARMAANELLLALHEPVRKPVYLAGQIGEAAVSVHGERGKLVIVTPGGGRQELSYDELGAGGGAGSQDTEVRDGDGEQRDGGGDEADASGRQAAALQGAASGAAGAGSLGGGDGGGEGEGAQELRGDPGVVGGSAEQGLGGGRAGGDGLAGVAVEPVGVEWDAGGAVAATEATREGGDEDGIGRSEPGPPLPAQGERGAEAPADGGGASDHPAAGPAGGEGAIAARSAGAEAAGGEGTVGGEKGGASPSGCGRA
jgi:transposase InsO family protein